MTTALILFFSIFPILSSEAQTPNAFNVAYQTAVLCLEDSLSIDDRMNCYASCVKAIGTQSDAVKCSRLKRNSEERVFFELFEREEGIHNEEHVKKVVTLASLRCQLMGLRGKTEVDKNECIAAEYMRYSQPDLAVQGN